MYVPVAGAQTCSGGTIESFIAHNTHPIEKYILIEDSASPEMARFIRRPPRATFDTIILNDPKLGQIRSIDRAYQEMDNPLRLPLRRRLAVRPQRLH